MTKTVKKKKQVTSVSAKNPVIGASVMISLALENQEINGEEDVNIFRLQLMWLMFIKISKTLGHN